VNTRILTALTALSGLLLAAPAAAQSDAIMNITVRRHVQSSDGNAAGKFSGGTTLLKTNNMHCSDVACCVTMQQLGATTTFGTVGDGLDVITSQAESNQVFAQPSHCKVIIAATAGCGGGVGGWVGCASIGVRNMILVASAPDCVWAHEFGHTQGLSHDQSCNDLIMHATNFGVDSVASGACNTFRSSPDALGPACGGGTPTQDDCAGATAVGDGVHFFSTVGMTASGLMASGLAPYAAGQPNTACEQFAGNIPSDLNLDIFFEWTAGFTDSYSLSTCDDVSYDSKIAVYAGTCASPVALSCNDDGPGCMGFTSTLNVTGISSGQTYIVQLGGFNASDSGAGNLTIAQDNPVMAPPNDLCPGAIAIGDGVIATDTTTATPSGILADALPPYAPDTANTACQDVGAGNPADLHKDLWYLWTAGSTGDYTLSTCGTAAYDTKLALYSACGGFAIACNDDGTGCSGFTSELHAAGISAGSSYAVQVGGFDLTTFGAASLDISPDMVGPPPPTNYCTGAPNSVGAGSQMLWSGSTSYAANNMTLFAANGPSGQAGLFYYGPNQISVAFGEGIRCVGGATDRLNPPVFSDVFGQWTRPLNFLGTPMNAGSGLVLPGTTFNTQCWYRDPAGGPSGFNLSDGLSVTVGP